MRHLPPEQMTALPGAPLEGNAIERPSLPKTSWQQQRPRRNTMCLEPKLHFEEKRAEVLNSSAIDEAVQEISANRLQTSRNVLNNNKLMGIDKSTMKSIKFNTSTMASREKLAVEDECRDA